MLPTLSDVDKAEEAFLGPTGKPVLNESLALLRERWSAGCRDRETALRLLFVCWYCNIEPPFLTGVSEVPDLHRLCQEAFETLGGGSSPDPEVCYTVKLMVELCPWCLGDPAYWEEHAPPDGSETYAKRVKLEQFAERGAYGEYFRSMLSSPFRLGS